MKKLTTTTIALVLLTLLSVLTFADEGSKNPTTFNSRLLIHGTKSITGPWSWAGWSVLPNYAADPSKVLVVTGPRYEGKNWWLETMAGFLIVDQEGKGLIDIRASYDVLDPFHFWGEIICFPKKKDPWYTYGEVNYKLPVVGLLGLETENSHPDYSWGPHLVIPLGDHLTLVGVYQFHPRSGETDQVWFRTVINLSKIR